jgi:hypothetical protein
MPKYGLGMKVQVIESDTAMEPDYRNNQGRLALGQTTSRYKRLVSVCNVQEVVNVDTLGVSSKLVVQLVGITNPVACSLIL